MAPEALWRDKPKPKAKVVVINFYRCLCVYDLCSIRSVGLCKCNDTTAQPGILRFRQQTFLRFSEVNQSFGGFDTFFQRDPSDACMALTGV